jgi:hypothetical protein
LLFEFRLASQQAQASKAKVVTPKLPNAAGVDGLEQKEHLLTLRRASQKTGKVGRRC